MSRIDSRTAKCYPTQDYCLGLIQEQQGLRCSVWRPSRSIGEEGGADIGGVGDELDADGGLELRERRLDRGRLE